MRARDLMTAEVVTVTPNTPVPEIARTMTERRISALPVVDNGGRVVGIVTEGDLMRRAESGTERQPGWLASLFADPQSLAARYAKSHGHKAKDVMTSQVVSVGEDAEAAAIADLMDRNDVKRVLVVREGKLAGIVSRADLLRALTGPVAESAPQSDAVIHEAVMAEIRRQPWASTFHMAVIVHNGAVEYYGYCRSEEERRALRVLAEGVPGVRAVNDNLVVGIPYAAD